MILKKKLAGIVLAIGAASMFALVPAISSAASNGTAAQHTSVNGCKGKSACKKCDKCKTKNVCNCKNGCKDKSNKTDDKAAN